MSLLDQAADILAAAARAEGVRDAMIASRDGLPAMGDLNQGSRDTVAAMAAASIAAAETASMSAGNGPVDHVRARAGNAELLVGGLDDEYILILVCEMSDVASAAFDKARADLKLALN